MWQICKVFLLLKEINTETAVLKMVSDALSAAERGEVTLLGMLDMSAAFDTVDHGILLKRLHMSFGICEVALSWISSFVRQRTQAVVVNDKMSETSLVTCGVPQGSVLGPILFLLYTPDVHASSRDAWHQLPLICRRLGIISSPQGKRNCFDSSSGRLVH